MIGNAIPPLLTFYIGQSMLNTPLNKLVAPTKAIKNVSLSKEKAVEITPDKAGKKFKINRSFWIAIPHLRFGSGMRFDLKNSFGEKNGDAQWKVNFFHGTSKEIKELDIDSRVYKSSLTLFDKLASNELKVLYDTYAYEVSILDHNRIQQCWTNSLHKDSHHPFKIVDHLGDFAGKIIEELKQSDNEAQVHRYIENLFLKGVDKVNAKILLNSTRIFSGLLIAGIFNRVIHYKKVGVEREVVAA